jgi:hypothetical protein
VLEHEMNKMKKAVSHTFSYAVGVVSLLLVLNGCVWEQVFTQDLFIENTSNSAISHCEEYELPNCVHRIEPGQTVRLPYLLRSSSEIGNYSEFDKIKINICDRQLDLKTIRSFNPIVKRNENQFELTIDNSIYEKVCH